MVAFVLIPGCAGAVPGPGEGGPDTDAIAEGTEDTAPVDDPPSPDGTDDDSQGTPQDEPVDDADVTPPGSEFPVELPDGQIPEDPADWPRDQWLVGTWLHETNFFDNISGYSSTTSTTLTLGLDGTFERSTTTWASDPNLIVNTGDDVETGVWGTIQGWLYLVLPNDDYYEYSYNVEEVVGDLTMMLQTEGGENVLWTYME